MFIYIFFEIKREDFVAMLLHHIATAILIFCSYVRGDLRIGSVILFIHDITDITNSLVKMVNHIRWKKSAVVVFAIVLINWLYWRIFIFSKAIYLTAVNDDTSLISKQVCVPLLSLLLILHIYWYFMFMKIGYYLIFHSKVVDITEDKFKNKKQNINK
jgi:hypothetical protein